MLSVQQASPVRKCSRAHLLHARLNCDLKGLLLRHQALALALPAHVTGRNGGAAPLAGGAPLLDLLHHAWAKRTDHDLHSGALTRLQGASEEMKR